MCRYATALLPAQPRTASVARSFLAEQATSWGVPEVVEDAQLILSELVTNALVHVQDSEITVTLSCAAAVFEVAVFDTSPALPLARATGANMDGLAHFQPSEHPTGEVRAHVRDAGPLAAGRGLQLVDALAESWGAAPQERGKSVWARLPLPATWATSASCTCGDSPEGVGLASGHRSVDRG